MPRLTFRRCGYAGLAAACAVALGISLATGRSPWVQAAVVAAAIAAFLLVALATKVVLGRERLVYYHHEIAVLAVAAAVLAAMGAPVLAHLDATALGLGVFLTFGRVGCWTAGCCHGRPTRRRGVVYGERHARAGFAGYLVGVPLVPVQLLEAAAAAILVSAGSVLVLGGTAPGSAFVLYVQGYAVARFALEPLRGDPVRPYARGVSEAQWTSLILSALVAATAIAGVLPGGSAAVAVTAGLALATALTVHRTPGLLDAAHVREIASRIAAGPCEGERPRVIRTSGGLSLSCGRTAGVAHYALSVPGRRLTHPEARALGRVLLALRHGAGEAELVAGPGGVWHVLPR